MGEGEEMGRIRTPLCGLARRSGLVLFSVAALLYSQGAPATPIVLFPGTPSAVTDNLAGDLAPLVANVITVNNLAIPGLGVGGPTFSGTLSGVKNGYVFRGKVTSGAAAASNFATPVLWFQQTEPVSFFGCGLLCPDMFTFLDGTLEAKAVGANLAGGEKFAVAFNAAPTNFSTSFATSQWTAPADANTKNKVDVKAPSQVILGGVRPIQKNVTFKGFFGFTIGANEEFDFPIGLGITCGTNCFDNPRQPGVISEPATLFLMGIGLAGLGLIGLARQRKLNA
jgi:hypothetical protein